MCQTKKSGNSSTVPASMEAGGIEPPSRDDSCNGLYMFSQSFNLDLPGEDGHPTGRSNRQFLTRAPTVERASQPLCTIPQVEAS